VSSWCIRSGSSGDGGEHLEEEGTGGLADRRLGRASERRVLVNRIVWTIGKCQTRAGSQTEYPPSMSYQPFAVTHPR
jgi:hypothetical protein